MSLRCFLPLGSDIAVVVAFILGLLFYFTSSSSFVAAQFAFETSVSGDTAPVVERNFTGITVDDSTGSIYVASSGTPSQLVKFATEPLVRVAGVEFDALNNESGCHSLKYYNGYVYLACAPTLAGGSGDGVIMRRNATDLSAAGVIVRSGPSESTLKNIFVFDPFVYAVSADDPSSIIRIHLDNFTVKDTLELTGVSNVQAALITTNGSHIYYATSTSPVNLLKQETNVWDRFYILQIALETGEDGIDRGLAEDGTFLYAATTQASPAFVVKVNMYHFSRVGAIALDSASSEDVCRGMFVDALTGSAYITVDFSTPSRVVYVDLNTFARMYAINSTGSGSDPDQIIMYNQKLYVTASGGGNSSSTPDVVLQFSTITTTTTSTTTTQGPTTTTQSTTTLEPTTTTTTATTTSTTATTTTTTTTTPAPPTPVPEFGDGDNSVALSGPSFVAIAAGISAGVAVIILGILLFAVGGKTTAGSVLSGSGKKKGVDEHDNNDNNTNNSVQSTTTHHEEGGGAHIVPAEANGHDDVFNSDEHQNDFHDENDQEHQEMSNLLPPLDADARNAEGIMQMGSQNGLDEQNMMGGGNGGADAGNF